MWQRFWITQMPFRSLDIYKLGSWAEGKECVSSVTKSTLLTAFPVRVYNLTYCEHILFIGLHHPASIFHRMDKCQSFGSLFLCVYAL